MMLSLRSVPLVMPMILSYDAVSAAGCDLTLPTIGPFGVPLR